MFAYDKTTKTIPFVITGQNNAEELCYEITNEMEVKFEFAPTKKPNILWKYTLEQQNDNKREVVQGYFKLSDTLPTLLDLSKYKKTLKWIRFTAFNTRNPMKRAWFSPIKGEAFGKPTSKFKFDLTL